MEKIIENLNNQSFENILNYINNIDHNKHNDYYCKDDIYVLNSDSKHSVFYKNLIWKIYFYGENKHSNFYVQSKNNMIDVIINNIIEFTTDHFPKVEYVQINDISYDLYSVNQNMILFINPTLKYFMTVRPFYHGISLAMYISYKQGIKNEEYSRILRLNDSCYDFLNIINERENQIILLKFLFLEKETLIKTIVNHFNQSVTFHYNLKPSNIIITMDGIKFVDEYDCIFYDCNYHGYATDNSNSCTQFKSNNYILHGRFCSLDHIYGLSINLIALITTPFNNKSGAKKKILSASSHDVLVKKIIEIINYNMNNNILKPFKFT